MRFENVCDMIHVEMMKMNPLSKITEKPFYKWIIAAVSFLMTFTVLGFCSSTKSVYITAITDALDIKRSVYSLSDTFRYITTTVLNLFFGVIVAKVGPRKLIGAGFLSTTVAMALYAWGDNVVYFYIGSIFLGIGVAWTTTTMVGTVVSRWFTTNRGTVMGAILAANGLGATLALQIVTPIINESVFGYRNAYKLTAVILLIVGTLVVLLLRNDPKEQEQGQAKKKAKRGRSWAGVTYSDGVKKAYFYGAVACIFITGMMLQGISGVTAPHLKDIGFDPSYIALVLSAHSISLTVFKFGVGWIYDRKGLRFTSNVCFIASVVVMLAMAVIANNVTGRALAMICTVGMSLALPLETVMLPIYAADLFGEHSYNKFLGIVSAANTAGFALGAPTANLVFDLTGSYIGAFYGGAALMVIATVVMQFVVTAAHKEQKKVEVAQ